jgi:hypothetical protein
MLKQTKKTGQPKVPFPLLLWHARTSSPLDSPRDVFPTDERTTDIYGGKDNIESVSSRSRGGIEKGGNGDVRSFAG